MIVEAILSLAFMAEPGTKPEMLAPFDSLDACLVAADKRNRTDETLRVAPLRPRGAEYVCLQVKRAGV
jgi:uncharacterized radical SAM superfamily protein